MNGLEGFKRKAVKEIPNQKVKISDRFPEFEIKCLSAEDNKRLRKECIKRVKTKNGFEEKTDSDLYLDKLVVESVVYPPFKSQELQDDWGVMGAESLLGAMLSVGEYVELLNAVKDINGFDVDPKEENEELKN